ncbi:lipopolysaccharide biosynthesis protein [Paenibacillus curdlanolyticus YK9]|uniref:Lipopolysaccharide biosynthesis protein n=1 Tax=Paenibacillus curdlanolyticus YK9 TaxID=717606 RepID=E0IES1_9BACL|nr:Wzz/FepE/Etk N-terminal domain-containing protein [Paenibacillus curdlanolyticus]EFM09159.1 lipopolysaccharide biosynthesis protein [Paenibacillus curdlanolyticus YK9]
MPEELELLDYWRILRHRLWIMIVMVVFGVSIAFGYGQFMQKPNYEANAKLVIRHSVDDASALASEIDAIEANLKMMDTYKEFIRTPVVMDKVVAEHPELGLRSGELASRIKVNAGLNSQLLTIVAHDGSYSRAAQIANAVSEVFLSEAKRVFRVSNMDLLYKADPAPKDLPAPVGMNLKMLLAIAFIVSSMLGAGICVLLAYLDRSIRSERDIQRVLQLPTFIELPLYMESKKRMGGRKASMPKRGRAGEDRDVPLEK